LRRVQENGGSGTQHLRAVQLKCHTRQSSEASWIDGKTRYRSQSLTARIT